ncbi:SPRY domain protein [Aspergillus fischeri NRRL 181]|uniref:SPRY domain protein n=1 Tax=Neosartorya fischeri (strain ATCC 1020 / DSM 3700 / CBS 544.65 / FGSC A1164 / JCM 1740 / NRRL 181 / WB 181) TaxID=331117 RepID=A1DGC1_NEOFI|nr:SPRY domain protein [Aspergillus fischeri NRRL 181]EAW18428.1 SPRY domain protein [Aspergillus fischeri NRRL 181]
MSYDLQTASWKGNIEDVEHLLADGANAASANRCGWIPLHAASWNGDIQVVRLLLAKGAHPTGKSNIGWTPLDAAFAIGRVDTVRLLFPHDPDAAADFTPTSFSDIRKSGVLELDSEKLEFNSAIALGVCRENSALERMPGWEGTSWGYHGDDGKKFHSASQGQPYAEKFGDGDRIGCRLEMSSGNLEFLKNGRSLGASLRDSCSAFAWWLMIVQELHLRVSMALYSRW